MKNPLIWLISFYRKNISTLKKAPCCKFVPTCSTYALEAVKVHGALKGTILSVLRILRCNPFSRGGYDPVPEKKIKKIEFSAERKFSGKTSAK